MTPPATPAPPLTTRARALLVALSVLALQLAWLAAPAYACGCGAMVPRDGERIFVNEETSAVSWDGRTEQIVMRLSMGGTGRAAAWIMPVPHRADVELGDPELFTQLAEATEPEHRTRHHFWPRGDDWPFDGGNAGDGAAAPSAPAPGSGVGVVGREHLGPFDVARLTATDPDALADWLKENGFRLPERLSKALQPYVDQGWEYVAIRLAPEEKGRTLAGQLDPLHLTFASDRLVYPMRLSRLARDSQHLNLYVLARHRMEPRSAIGGSAPKVTYAGRLTATHGALEQLARDTPYLTAYTQEFGIPAAIGGDHELRRAAHDTPYRTIIWKNELLTVGPGMPVWLLTVLGTLAAALAALLLVRRAHRRRPVIAPPPVTVPPPLG
ncbi:DUF2330 domain-containing protein [Streptomyces sp. SID8379]|uniref:DUF2330 domain-containing protein n=1 Tax=unclassified Streptomyces TaxID=2593676 RepID=UPI0003776075|nr:MULTISPECIES: DUF2330 domain-containing protein [unclassified Streptomyces]MYW64472.1 DUF2330 domain-containing protein [Streptomyces sp. SID8379]